MDGKIIHQIDNVDDYYLEFAYTAKMVEAGVLPEEYIWMTYIQNATSNFAVFRQSGKLKI